MREPFIKKDIVFLCVAAFLGIAAIFAFFQFNTSVFPQHHIDLSISKEFSEEKAVDFLKGKGVKTDEYKRVTVFYEKSAVKEFLEKNLGVRDAGFLMNDKITVWNFITRFFISSEQVEYEISYDNKGRLESYNKIIPEDGEGATLSEDDARRRAEAFLVNYTRFDPHILQFTEKNSYEKSKRRDYRFVWEDSFREILGAKYRVIIEVSGDEITGYGHSLRIPEQWLRDNIKIAGYNSTTQTIAEVIYIIAIIIPIIVLIVIKFRSRQLNYRFGIFAAIIVALATFINSVISLPVMPFWYDTTESWQAFWGGVWFGWGIGALLAGLSFFFVALAAEAAFRAAYADKQTLWGFSLKDFFSRKSTVFSLWIGFFAGFLALAYQMLYYLIGIKVGFWVPSEVNYSGAFHFFQPWVLIATMLIPAITEEFTFRLFGISLFKKLFKKTWLAVLATSVIWAFLHSAYPQQPFYARGIELIPIGILFGALFTRFGIFASIVAHFTLNAALTAQFLLKLNNIAVQIMSVWLVIIPFALALLVIVLHFVRRRVSEDSVVATNEMTTAQFQNLPHIEEVLRRADAITYISFSKRTKIITGVLGVISFILITTLPFGEPSDEYNLSFPKNRYEIGRVADAYLAERNIQVETYHRTISLDYNFSNTWREYITEKAGAEALRSIFDKRVPAAVWEARYFRPLKPEEFYVTLLPDGTAYSFTRVLPETTPGAMLNQKDAAEIAWRHLTEAKRYSVEEWALVDSKQYKKESRVDYYFTFQNKSVSLAGAQLRAAVGVQGDTVNGFNEYIHVPEEWLRERQKTGFADFAVSAVLGIFSLIMMGAVILSFLQVHRKKLIPWKRSLKIIAGLCGVYALISVNELAGYFYGYSTMQSFALYHLEQIIYLALGLTAFLLVGTVALGFALGLWRENVADKILPARSPDYSSIIKDSVFFGFLAPLCVIGAIVSLVFIFDQVMALTGWDAVPEEYFIMLPTLPLEINTFIPAVSVLGIIAIGIVLAISFSIPLLVAYRFLKRWWLAISALLMPYVIASIYFSDTWMDAGMTLGVGGIVLLSALLLWHIIYRHNPLALLVSLYFFLIIAGGLDFWLDNSFYKINSIIVFLGLLIPFTLAWYMIKRASSSST